MNETMENNVEIAEVETVEIATTDIDVVDTGCKSDFQRKDAFVAGAVGVGVAVLVAKVVVPLAKKGGRLAINKAKAVKAKLAEKKAAKAEAKNKVSDEESDGEEE